MAFVSGRNICISFIGGRRKYVIKSLLPQDDLLKQQMNNFLLSTQSQQEMASLDNKVTKHVKIHISMPTPHHGNLLDAPYVSIDEPCWPHLLKCIILSRFFYSSGKCPKFMPWHAITVNVMTDCQLRESSFESTSCYCEAWVVLFSIAGLEFGLFEGKASWPWLLKIIRGHRGQYAGHQSHWYCK